MEKTFYIEVRTRDRSRADYTIYDPFLPWSFYFHYETETEARFALNDLGHHSIVNEDIQFRLICVKKEEISSCSLGSWKVSTT